MSVLGRLFRGETRFDFVGARRRWFAVSAVLVTLALVSLGVRQLNLSVDFRGGLSVFVENQAQVGIEDVRSALVPLGLADARIQMVEGGEAIRVQTASLPAEREERLVATIADIAGVTVDDTTVESVGPTFGAQIAQRALVALLVFLGAVLLFMAWRLEWKMAVGGMAALFHDLILTAGIYSITGFEVTPATVVAILTILGYSLYDTVVVFDKVAENVDEYHDVETYTGIVNLSMNQVLMRSINTSLTSLLPVGSLLFVGSFLLGATTLREFALALFVGIGAGTYSSIFFASPLLALWKERQTEWQVVQRRVARKAGRTSSAPAAQAAAQPARSESAETEPALTSPTDEVTVAPGTGATPRPPKKRRRKKR